MSQEVFEAFLCCRGASEDLHSLLFMGGYAPLGVPTSRPLEHASDLDDTVSDDWAWLRGNHYIQAGADVVLGTKRQNAFAGAANGQWTFCGHPVSNAPTLQRG